MPVPSHVMSSDISKNRLCRFPDDFAESEKALLEDKDLDDRDRFIA
jgi:hypothetical protein